VDDLTERVNSCELHIPEGTGTKKVAVGVVNAIDQTRTPRIHGQLVPEGYARVLVDRMERGCASVPLDIEGGDGEKTLGEAEKTFICWCKRFIIIPRVSPPPLLGILNVITKSRLNFLILITVPKMPNLSLMPLKPSCHPQHDMRDAALKYAITLLNE